MLEVTNLSKEMDGKLVLEDVNFSLFRGKISALVGRNGAGKTTLLRLMMGILDPVRGEVKIEGKSIHKHPSVKEKMVFVPDSPEAFMNYRVEDLIHLYQNIYPDFDRGECLSLMDQFQLPRNRKLRNYSKGMRILFLLILSFSTHASFILLDEPTNGLDPVVKKKVLRLLVERAAEQDVSVFISSHQLEEIERIADEVLFLKEGRITDVLSFAEQNTGVEKWQVVFQGEASQSILSLPNLRILNQIGRVYTFIVNGEIEAARLLLEQEKPLLFENLAVSLEDLYMLKLGDDSDVS